MVRWHDPARITLRLFGNLVDFSLLLFSHKKTLTSKPVHFAASQNQGTTKAPFVLQSSGGVVQGWLGKREPER
jgi:hypothetical protein